MSRIRTKGHYRIVERDEKGRFVKVEKWTPKKTTTCPHCGYENPTNQQGCNKCGEIYNPPLKTTFCEKHAKEEIN